MKFDIILHNFPPKIHPTKFNIALISRKKSRLISLNFPRTRVHFQLFINTTIDQTIHPPTINLSIPYDTRETYLTPRITKTKKGKNNHLDTTPSPRITFSRLEPYPLPYPFPPPNHPSVQLLHACRTREGRSRRVYARA